jgi:hypothetical protein
MVGNSTSKSNQLTDQYGFITECTPMDELRVITPVRLVGSVFVGNVVDPNFWTVTNSNGGTTTSANSQITLSTNTTSNGSTVIQSIRKARYTGGSSNRFRSQIRLSDSGVVNNVKRWGIFDGTNGAYFKLNGTTLSTCTMKGGVESVVNTSNWNGNIPSMNLTNINSYEIYITNAKIYFVIAGILVNIINASQTTWTDNMHLPIRIDNTNSEGGVTNTSIECRVATIYRLGNLVTDTQYGRVTTASTSVMKYGAGVLHRVTVNTAFAGAGISIYDGLSGSGSLVAAIAYGSKNDAPATLEYGIPFSIGLTVISTNTWDATVVYE